MKRSPWLAVAGVLALVTSVSWAGDGKGRWASTAGLSEEQKEKLTDAFKDGRKTMRPLRRELRDAMTKLHDQLEDEADEGALKATLERIDKAKQAVSSERARFQAKLGGMLPVKERAKLLLARRHRMGLQGMMLDRFAKMGMHHQGPRRAPRKHGPGPDKGGDDSKDALHDDDEEDEEEPDSHELDD